MKNTYAVFLFDLYGTLVDIRTDEEDPSFWRACFRQMDKTEEVPDPEATAEAVFFAGIRRRKAGAAAAGTLRGNRPGRRIPAASPECRKAVGLPYRAGLCRLLPGSLQSLTDVMALIG